MPNSYLSTFSSPIGDLFLEFSSKGLKRISITQQIEAESNPFPDFEKQSFHALEQFFEAKEVQLPELDWSNTTNFQKQVLKELLRTQPGQTLSYGTLAQKVGSPKAARAVGTCMSQNPWPLLVPCHRIIPSSGKLGNYSLGGPAIKAQLLLMENPSKTLDKS